jgi:hypothetical protein
VDNLLEDEDERCEEVLELDLMELYRSEDDEKRLKLFKQWLLVMVMVLP